MKFGIGQSVRRTEDIRFITGQGQYTDDLRFPDEAHAAFARSPHSHARILSIDIAAAQGAPGVIAVLTHEDVEAFGAGPMPCMAPLKSRDGTDVKPSPKCLLAKGKVTFTGEAVAMVVAESYAQAVDAAELVAIDYEALDAVGTLDAAPLGPQIWESSPGNECFDWAGGDEEKVTAAFAAAAHVVSVDTVQNRVAPSSMETRNAIGFYDAVADSFTLYSGNQGSANLRDRVAKGVLNLPPEKLRVVNKDVGGGFGMKAFMYPEQSLVLIAAKKAGRPVRWTSDRTEAFLTDNHGRDMIVKGELALDADGRILAMRVTGSANMGGYLSQFNPFVATLAGGRIFGGVYRVPCLYAAIKGYFSNSGPLDAYRGAGRPEAAYLMERLMDVAARKTGIDRVELRRRNLPTPDELPFKNWFGIVFDSGDYPRMLDEALKRADAQGFAARKARSAAKGKLRGLGIAYYVEITFAIGAEPARVVFTENGGVDLYVGTQSNGQGHETAFAQLVAERLGVPFESITVRQGDTEWVNGGGTGGSRSLNMSGGALLGASDEVIRKGKVAAGQVLQAGGAEVGFEVVEGIGTFRVAGGESGSERTISVGELAVSLKRDKLPGFENGLDSDATFNGAASTFPNGCHVCEVEIDPDTGKVEIASYCVLDDFGRVINPMLVAGQVHGGVVQGLGQALCEHMIYDRDSGQAISASFTDYAMPRAEDMPDIAFAYEEIPCRTHALGAKGCGEAGTVGALPVAISAICDALDIDHLDMPATSEKVWRAIRDRRAAAA
jgi:carbon-monoxide dehydrogenase large subunit